MATEYRSFRDCCPGYLAEHRHPVSRRLYVLGTSPVPATLVWAVVTGRWLWLVAMPLFGYGPARLGRFAFERNRSASFRHPLDGPAGDFVMFRDMLLGRVSRR